MSRPAEQPKTVANPVTTPTEEELTLTKFLQDAPLYSPRRVTKLYSTLNPVRLAFPETIRVHCEHEDCSGERRHTVYSSTNAFRVGVSHYSWTSYICVDCAETTKVFGLKTRILAESYDGIASKVYQEPAFGQPIPKRLFPLIGESNRDFFLQARRAIARGLGIGAYAYYRRIVENNKLALVDAVLDVAKATRAPREQIQRLEAAQTERQFTKAIDMLRDVSAIPPVLLIDGHNPLTLLHDLLSEGIHKLCDQECLERAQHAEIVLFELAELLRTAVTERKTVKAAITSIMSRKNSGGADNGS